MPRQKSLITETEIDAFANKLKTLVRHAAREASVASTLQKLMAEFSHGTATRVPRAAAATGPKAEKAGPGRRRRRGNPALEQKIIELVKGSKGGLGSPEIAQKANAPKDRVKGIAQRLKAKGMFRVVGVKRQAKYQFVG